MDDWLGLIFYHRPLCSSTILVYLDRKNYAKTGADEHHKMTSRINKFFALLGNPFYRRVFIRHHVAAAVEHDMVLSTIGGALQTVVDIGANRGQFALAARHHAPGAYIIAFEPLVEPAEVFREVFRKDAKVELHLCAIGSQQGDALMYISGADDSSSLLPITDLQTRLFPGTQESSTRRVTVTPLEKALFPQQIVSPALLKIDVQGYELQVLKGGKSLLGCFDFLLVECSYKTLYNGQALAGEVLRYLGEAGFVLVQRFNLLCDENGEPIQADFFLRRK